MCPSTRWSRIRVTIPRILVAALFLPAGCKESSTGPPVDVEPFREMAAHDPCASLRNKLFLIDWYLVFWSRAGTCPDAAWEDVLYVGSVDSIACASHDSITGPRRVCREAGYREMFNNIIANRDRPDLGLGPSHTVRAVPV